VIVTRIPGTNPDPLMVCVKVFWPAIAVEGTMLVIVGTGLLMVNVNGFEASAPGLVTVTATVPPVERLLLGIVTVT
jgi:hypothetical protein